MFGTGVNKPFPKSSDLNSGPVPVPGHKVSALFSGTKWYLGLKNKPCLNATLFCARDFVPGTSNWAPCVDTTLDPRPGLFERWINHNAINHINYILVDSVLHPLNNWGQFVRNGKEKEEVRVPGQQSFVCPCRVGFVCKYCFYGGLEYQ